MYSVNNFLRIFSRLRNAALLLLVAMTSMVATLSYADVSGEGDITPSMSSTDFQGNPTTVPDLPVEGGNLGGSLVVGGTGSRVGDTTFGRLSINNPLFTNPLVTDSAILGLEENGVGQVTVSGFTSQLLVRGGDIVVGDAGQGYLEINGGGVVTTAPMLDMDGMPSGSAGNAIFGEDFTSRGNLVAITGFASVFEVGDLTIAEHGDATVDVTNQGTLRTATTLIGAMKNSLGTAKFSGQGTRWINSEDVEIGTDAGSANDENGHGILEIYTGAIVRIGDPDSSSPGSTEFDSGETNVNQLGRIELAGGSLLTYDLNNAGIIRGYGTLQATNDFVINPTGELRNAATTANERERLYIADPNTTVVNNGTIESLGGEMEFEPFVDNNLEIIARDAVMRFNGGLDNSGTISIGGDTTLHGDITSTSGGSIFVLSDSESLLVGDLTFSGGSILGLSIGAEAGTLDVTGMADLSGAILSLDYSAGIISQPGDSYQIFQADGGIAGTFPSFAVADGRLWDIDLLGTTDTLFATATAVVALPVGADFNGDGVVNELDIQIWKNNYPIASGAPKILGDADGDGDVDGADFMKLQRDFGIIPVPPIMAVPEPSTLVLALLTIGFCPRRRRRG